MNEMGMNQKEKKSIRLKFLAVTVFIVVAVSVSIWLFNSSKPSVEVEGRAHVAWWMGDEPYSGFTDQEWEILNLDMRNSKMFVVPKPTSKDGKYGIHLKDLEFLNKELPLRIIHKNGRYYWASNHNLPLKKYEKILPNKMDKKSLTYTIFKNPGGHGFILIWHMAPINFLPGICDRGDIAIDVNYNEYRTTDGGKFILYVGRTEPFPYPVPDLCYPRDSFPRGLFKKPPKYITYDDFIHGNY